MRHGPLHGIRVLDLTHVWAGPLAVRFLADFGADVVRVEAPDGRGPRAIPYTPLGGWLGGAPGEDPWNNNAMFAKLMRNRRSLCLDLKTTVGRDILLALVEQADVLVENFSAGTLNELNLGDDVLHARNPKLIYISMPGFGSTGPLQDRVAFGPSAEALCGLADVFGYSPSEPRNTAMALLDPIGGCNAVAAVAQGLLDRDRSGAGEMLELALFEGGVGYNGPWLIDAQLDQPAECRGNQHPQMAPHGIYPCAGEDQWLAVSCADCDQWRGLAALLDMEPSWSLTDRLSKHAEIDDRLTNWTLAQNKFAATEKLQSVGVAAGPVQTAPEMVSDEHIQSRHFFSTYERFQTPMPGNPIHMQGIDSAQWQACPRLGEHNAQVLAHWLKWDAEQIDAAMKSGALYDAPPA